MRGIEALLLAGFVGLIGIGVWNGRQWLPDWGSKAVHSAAVDRSKVPGGLTEKAGTKPLRLRVKRGDGVHRTAAEDLAESELPISKTEVDVPSAEFPTGKDLHVGTPGVQVRAQYGEPTARVTEIRGGRVFEHYYYFSRDRTRLTRATLESGIIISAESTLP